MPILLSQLPAALLAIFVMAGLAGTANLMARWTRPANSEAGQLDPIGWCVALLFVICAALGTRTWARGWWIEWVCLAMLAPGALSFFHKSTVEIRELAWGKNSLARWFTVAIALILFLDFLYATLPLYRYDQWTYHLVVAKWIAAAGGLTPPVTYDHIFFTGTYEFLGLLARAVSNSDTFQQGFQNGLSWLLVAVPAALLFGSKRRAAGYGLAAALAFALLCIFGTGDHEAIINTKPDYILMMVATLLLIFAISGPRMLHPGLAGFLLVGGLGFKITWLHFAACAPFIIWTATARNVRRDTWKFVIGSTAALPCLLPWALKNWEFFRNPLHPAQSRLFTSSIWSPMLDEYWRSIAMRPVGGAEWISNFFQAATHLPLRWGVTGAIAAGILFVARNSREHSTGGRMRWDGLVLSLIGYITVWGSFYGAGIFNRFVASAFAFPLVLIWWWGRSLPLNSRTILLLTVPFLVHGQIEVTIPRLARAATHPWAEFAAGEKGPLQKIPDLLAIANDRSRQFPGAEYTRASLLSDFAFNYYGPSAFWIASDAVTWWQMEHAGINPFDGDGREFLRRMDIRYVWIVDPAIFEKAPPALRKVIPELHPLPAKIGNLYRVD